MSYGREKYDGIIARRDTGNAERGNTLGAQSQNDKHVASKRTDRNFRFLDNIEDDSEESCNDRYIITYADLITLLLGLFIILYAISNIDLNKYEKMMVAMSNVLGSTGEIPRLNEKSRSLISSPIDNLKNDLSIVIKKHKYDKSVSLEENERGVIIHILDDILFESGKADLSIHAEKVLNKIAQTIKILPNDIRIEGHTDDKKISTIRYPSNWHLSITRALNTAYYLIEAEGLSPDKLSIVGYSEYKPLADNSTSDGKNKNRRVDIVIIK